jgi:hypothetical protein
MLKSVEYQNFCGRHNRNTNEILNHLLALRKVDKALIDSLKAAVYFLDQIDQISEEQRMSMVKSLNGLIAQSEAVYGEAPTKH